MRQCVSQIITTFFMKKNETKAALKKAVIRLLEKKIFTDISVTELVQEAKISRASFYRIYSNIDQVVDEIIHEIEDYFVTNMLPNIKVHDKESIIGYIKSFFLKVKDKSVPFYNILPENFSYVIAKIERNVTIFNVDKTAPITEKYLRSLFFIIIINIAKIWEKYNYREDVNELAIFTYNFIYRPSKF